MLNCRIENCLCSIYAASAAGEPQPQLAGLALLLLSLSFPLHRGLSDGKGVAKVAGHNDAPHEEGQCFEQLLQADADEGGQRGL